MTSELRIEESKFAEIKRIEPGVESISLFNSLGIGVDPAALLDHLDTVEGTAPIKKLTIEYSSFLKDLKVIKAFPSLSIVRVYGHKILSMEGLEWFAHADLLVISTESNRRRIVRGLSHAPIKRMDVQFARPEDIDGIGECYSLRSLDFYKSKEIDFSKWNKLHMESLGLMQGRFDVLKDMSQVSGLRNLKVLGCRSLERFEGDNSQVEWLIIEGCKKLDLRTLQTFQGIQSMLINGTGFETALSELGMLGKLTSLKLWNCKVQVDVSDLRNQFPMLEELDISTMAKEQTMELSRLNPGITIKGKRKIVLYEVSNSN